MNSQALLPVTKVLEWKREGAFLRLNQSIEQLLSVLVEYNKAAGAYVKSMNEMAIAIEAERIKLGRWS